MDRLHQLDRRVLAKGIDDAVPMRSQIVLANNGTDQIADSFFPYFGGGSPELVIRMPIATGYVVEQRKDRPQLYRRRIR